MVVNTEVSTHWFTGKSPGPDLSIISLGNKRDSGQGVEQSDSVCVCVCYGRDNSSEEKAGKEGNVCNEEGEKADTGVQR